MDTCELQFNRQKQTASNKQFNKTIVYEIKTKKVNSKRQNISNCTFVGDFISKLLGINSNLHTMVYTLTTGKTDNSYLYGSVFLESEFICDTLEMTGCNLLKQGLYNLVLGASKIGQEKEILIIDKENKCVCQLVQKNTYNYKELVLRKDNNLISIGLKVNYPLLKMQNLVHSRLINDITHCGYRNETVELKIVRND